MSCTYCTCLVKQANDLQKIRSRVSQSLSFGLEMIDYLDHYLILMQFFCWKF